MKYAILAVGNELRTDDGIGIRVLRGLTEFNSKNYRRFEIGNNLFMVPELIKDYDVTIILDALPPAGQPGRVLAQRLDIKLQLESQRLSLHDLDLLWQIRFSIQKGYLGSVWIIGIEGYQMGLGVDISREIQHRLPAIMRETSTLIMKIVWQEDEKVLSKNCFSRYNI